MTNISLRLAQELQCKPAQVNAAIALLDEGATVPFIARYRKEVTGGLDDGQLRLLNERLRYLRELDDRRAAIIAAIDEQGQLTAALRAQLAGADNKQALEDLYLPYKQKRRTKAQIAREAGLAVLAESLLKNPQQDPEKLAANFVCEGFADTKAVLEGVKAILLESWGEDAALIGQLRSHLQSNGLVTSKVVKGQENAGAKFSDYFDFSEKWAAMPSHRVLAVLRGANEKFLSIGIQLPEEIENGARSKIWSTAEEKIARHVGISANHSEGWLGDAVRAAWRSKLGVSLENELLSSARERAELDAIKVFSRNLKDLLLAAPAGPRCTLGLDPGLRTGVKVAVVDATGKLLATDTIYPHEPRRDWDKSLHTLKMLCDQHGVELIAIGNGTASRETEQLATELITMIENKKPTKVVVSEAGASVYSASELAAKEFPELDVSIRGAVSIARRLQDPLAELVKIDPKSIGVGQYQHDVNQNELARMLDAVVEDCVNAVGVDVNTASAALLSRVSGLSPVLAINVVAYRDEYGAFKNRKALLKVPRLGGKTFELAAGFLRIMNGDNPLDASAVHPEAYPVVEKLLQTLGKDLRSTMGDRAALQAVQPEVLVDAQFGLPTVKDILAELEKPGRDPRPEFKTATFAAGIEKINDLQIGMVLEGVVSNVTNFGAFVDVGVHQDGLVHISMLANTFVKDPHSVVKAGQVVKVKVLEVDVPRKRIALTMRLNDETPVKAAAPKPQVARHATQQKPSEPSAMANAFAGLKLKK
ncbi:RNA-binding transcriptional accessory protein [Chitinibacter bivalviorum]|uniref:RNA-binding transcriptional accessory protein n=1 Tax=Chitinibacter bivalviorum TaxID=2739434 RepID=A0A7H9BFB4_9NEIS|nr:Tex family protein [Chitinibacter bivalviorum]QLG87309.1 RNA-binding transcriptional accessory protein [Chitinibacter bivalviorum]